MATSTEISQRRLQRKKKRQRQYKMIIDGIVLLFTIIILFGFFVKINSCGKGKNNDIAEEALVIYPQPAPKTADVLESVPDSDGVKVAYLTFDDGPTTSVTPHVLDILRRYDVKATFFVLGSLVEANPAIAYRIHSEGHVLANHSYRHNYSYLYENETNFMSEINDTQKMIVKITDDENYPKIFRFPGGSYNSGSYGEAKQEYKKKLEEEGYRYCDWNCLSGDAEYKKPSAQNLLNRVKSSGKGKEDVVVLMHDSVTKKVNLEALPLIIEYLLSEGYTFKTLDKAP